MATAGSVLFSTAVLKELFACPQGGHRENVPLENVVIDSREVRGGSLFVPLAGERTDGHNFIPQVVAAGAAAVLVAEEKWAVHKEAWDVLGEKNAVVFLPVSDPLAAMQKLAADYLMRLDNLYRIGITGSNGKTTTKEIVGTILREHAETYSNPGNLNSEIGLPLSVFQIRREHRYAVLEMGMNFAGEMDILAGILRPRAALITNIGTAHIGPLGSRDAIAAEKKKAFKYFDGSQVGFLPEDEKYFDYLSRDVQGEIVSYGQRTTRGYQGYENRGLDGITIHWEGLRIQFPLAGGHNLKNALGALTLCRALGLEAPAIKRGLEAVRPLFGRSQILKGRLTIIQDCYNANPESMQTALEFFAELPWKGRKIAVLGSMRELGTASEDAHAALGRLAGDLDLDGIFFFGEETADAFSAAAESPIMGFLSQTADFDELLKEVRGFVREDDLLLLKGSRSLALERLAEELKD